MSSKDAHGCPHGRGMRDDMSISSSSPVACFRIPIDSVYFTCSMQEERLMNASTELFKTASYLHSAHMVPVGRNFCAMSVSLLALVTQQLYVYVNVQCDMIKSATGV